MFPIVEFCVSNLAQGSQEAKEILEKDPNLDVIEYGCLSYCGQCMQTLFALVNGEMVSGDNPAELVENIYKFIEENEMI
ncbi:YuzB family protein [Bacillus glycinifermentans]|uniref:YuzB family protein n=1 Tax=Bacillus glycinifermentans TaxID=1664069 RepID=UPI001FF4D819|nr:YuzB family protein [Bacillus glycinifermentans]UOY90576.1 YuzB family protein [Bacillus glycinifermentans]